MNFSQIEIKNFRSIESLQLSLSSFVCLIGHNNAGKSTVLVAITLFRSGSAIRETDFFDRTKEVSIKVTFEGINESSIAALSTEHASKIKELITDGSVTLVRRYAVNGKGELRVIQKAPREERFRGESVGSLLSGKKGATAIREALTATFPELTERIREQNPATQAAARSIVDEYVRTLPKEQFIECETPLPTGIPQSIEKLLPEVLYIPAVKDLSDDLKTKEASSFGKIIRVLLDMVNEVDDLKKVKESFSDLDKLLNRTVGHTGEFVDNRLGDLQRIERRMESFIKEQFQNVSVQIEIPPPDLKTIFGNAKIYLNDGVRTEVEAKGDGLKRAVLFSLLRTFVTLRKPSGQQVQAVASPQYMFLFEEPELYLHPSSQRILYDALRQIADEHQVCVCTHSPFFFSPSTTGTYIRLKKSTAVAEGRPPKCDSLTIDLSANVSTKDAFQIICFENSNAAFFSDRVLLVEGDCDIIFLRHLAHTLNPEWSFDRRNISIVKVGGKGSFQRYREFFETFDVQVRIVADLDVISDQFEKLRPSDEAIAIRQRLIAEAGRILVNTNVPELTKSQLQDLTRKFSFRDRYNRCRAIAKKVCEGLSLTDEELSDFSLLFADETKYGIRSLIQSEKSLNALKCKLITELRKSGIIVLARGAIEEYYPAGVHGDDKPSRALNACSLVQTREQALQLSDCLEGESTPELSLSFECIFS